MREPSRQAARRVRNTPRKGSSRNLFPSALREILLGVRSPTSPYLAQVEPPPPTCGDRIAALLDQELRLLAIGVGDHLPVEVSDRVARLRDERRELEFGRVAAPA